MSRPTGEVEKMLSLERPIPDCYWVQLNLLAGEYPGASQEKPARLKLGRLLQAGITFFLDLTEAGELHPYDPLLPEVAKPIGRQVEYRRLSIPDLCIPTLDRMTAILDTLDAALAAGHTVYVHCWGGIGRTGTVVGCYLVRHGQSGAEALTEIAQLRRVVPDEARVSPETEAQRDMVLNWIELGEQPQPGGCRREKSS